MRREEWYKLNSTYRYARKNKDYNAMSLLEYAHRELFISAPPIPILKNDIPQSSDLQRRLSHARILRNRRELAALL
jgi:hypothetical protein